MLSIVLKSQPPIIFDKINNGGHAVLKPKGKNQVTEEEILQTSPVLQRTKLKVQVIEYERLLVRSEI